MKDDVYLITGGTGFIGSFIVENLLQSDKEVHIIARSEKNNWRLGSPQSVNIHYTDILNLKSLTTLIQKINPSFIIHLAALVNSERNPESYENIIRTNIIGTKNLLTASQNIEYKLLINTGSSEEYGVGPVPCKEIQKECPVSPYSYSKVCCTYLCSMHSVLNNKPIITVRPFSTYGPKQMTTMLIPQLIVSGILGKELLLTKGEQARDFIFVKDVADAYCALCERYMNIDGYQIFNIGTGKKIKIIDVINLIGSYFPDNLFKVNSIPYKKGENMNFYSSIQKISNTIGRKPAINLKDGIDETILWYKANLQYLESVC